jgi:hypothetical protein
MEQMRKSFMGVAMAFNDLMLCDSPFKLKPNKYDKYYLDRLRITED